MNNPTGVIVDPFGVLFILDSGNNRVMRWVQGASYGTTIITSLSSPDGLIFGRTGNLVVSDTSNHRVVSYSMICRKIFFYFRMEIFITKIILLQQMLQQQQQHHQVCF